MDNLYLAQFHRPPLSIDTQEQYHLAQVVHVPESLDSFHNGSNCFGVSADLKCKNIQYELGPLQDSYPARRRPTTFRYHNSVTGLEIRGILVANATMFSHLLPGFSCGSKHLLLP